MTKINISTNAKIPSLHKCFLTGVSTNFNPTQATFHRDGYPSEVDLTLRFLETRTLDQQDIIKQHRWDNQLGTMDNRLSHDLSIINST